MSFLDAFFGRVFNQGTEQDLQGGLNFGAGMQATPVSASGWNLITVSAALQSMLRLLSIGHVQLSSIATTTPSGVDTWMLIAGTFELGAECDSDWTLAASGAGLVWGGTETVRVKATCTASLDPAGVNKIYAIGIAVEGVVAGEHTHTTPHLSSDAAIPVVDLVEVAPGETVSVMIQNHTDTTAVDVTHLSAVFEAVGAAIV